MAAILVTVELNDEPEEIIVCPKCAFENTTDFLECVSCGHLLRDVGAADAGAESVEVLSTWDSKVAENVQARLQAAGVECEVLDLGSANTEEMSALLRAPEQRMVPIIVLVPAEQVSRANAVIEPFRDKIDELLPVTEPPPEPAKPACPSCGTPYDPDEYDPRALRIYCTACEAELPRHAPGRFGGWSRPDGQ